MPLTYLDVPPAITANAKKKLVKEVYEAMHEALPIPDSRVLLREYPLENVSLDGHKVEDFASNGFIQTENPDMAPFAAALQ